MEKTFKIPKFDRKTGHKLRDENGNTQYTEFIYNFNKMGMNRKLMAQRFFELAEKQNEFKPNTDEQINVVAGRKLELKAFSALLIRMTDDGIPERYDPLITELNQYEVDELGKTEEEWNDLMAVKNDFFTKIGIISKTQMTESLNSIMPFLKLMQGLKQEGIEVKSQSEMMEVLEAIDVLQGTKSDT